MIAFVRGRLVACEEDEAVVDAGGFGFRLSLPPGTRARLPALGKEAVLWTELRVRDEEPVLFGFPTPEERTAFRLLLTVSGVGPRLALALLGTWAPADLYRLVAAGDAQALSRVPGVGRRTAERLIVELRDRLPAGWAPSAPQAGRRGSPVSHDAGRAGAGRDGRRAAVALAEAQAALEALGYTPQEAARAVGEAAGDGAEPVEELVRRSLRLLARG